MEKMRQETHRVSWPDQAHRLLLAVSFLETRGEKNSNLCSQTVWFVCTTDWRPLNMQKSLYSISFPEVWPKGQPGQRANFLTLPRLALCPGSTVYIYERNTPDHLFSVVCLWYGSCTHTYHIWSLLLLAKYACKTKTKNHTTEFTDIDR